MTKTSASEAARAAVEEWDSEEPMIPAYRKEDLIARLTPVFERAQVAERGPGMALYRSACAERDALRERAEAAEAERDARKALLHDYDHDIGVVQAKLDAAEADLAKVREELAANRACNLYTWKEQFQRAEADVKRLREAILFHTNRTDGGPECTHMYPETCLAAIMDEALAATALKVEEK